MVISDSQVAPNLISAATNEDPNFSLIWRIHDLLNREWECTLLHCWRECNWCADFLAKKVLEIKSRQILHYPLEDLCLLLSSEVAGVPTPRFCVVLAFSHPLAPQKKKRFCVVLTFSQSLAQKKNGL